MESPARSELMSVITHTIVDLDLPFALPIPDGDFKVKLRGLDAGILVKRIQHKQAGGWTLEGEGTVEIALDKRGRFAHTRARLKLPGKIDLHERGRQPRLINTPPRSRLKEIVLEVVNRFIDVVRFVTEEYQLGHISYPDILSYEVNFWDGSNMIPAGVVILDSGTGGFKLSTGPLPKFPEDKMQALTSLLEEGSDLDLSKTLVLDAKEAYLEEDFRKATTDSVTALEIRLSEFIRQRGQQLGVSADQIERFIVDVGLTGNLEVVLKLLLVGLEQPDPKLVATCKGAITERNHILHRGKRLIAPTETEERIEAIQSFLIYLDRLMDAINSESASPSTEKLPTT